ncbi:MAG: DUF2809 domain-containing protein [Gemmataceae bacterium]|nr:DUF2809 domain-containing protein [Gemmataceae bacterium]
MTGTRRSVRRRAAAAAAVVALGLLSRHPAVRPHLSGFVAEYAGDTLWALLVFLLVGIVRPRWPTVRAGAVALGFAFAVEFSQLLHAPWLDALRRTTAGHLVLGDTFIPSDLICYTVGVGLGVAAEVVTRARAAPGSPR